MARNDVGGISLKKTIILFFCFIFTVTIGSCSDNENPPQVTVTPEITAPTTFNPIETTTPSISEFGPEDWSVLGIQLGDSIESILSVLGEPERNETLYSGAWDEDVHSFYYPFGVIKFVSYGAIWIEINIAGYAGPRNIQVGDDLNNILKNFPATPTEEMDSSGKYYIYGDDEAVSRAFLYKDGDGNINTLFFVYGGNATVPIVFRADIEEGYISAFYLYEGL